MMMNRDGVMMAPDLGPILLQSFVGKKWGGGILGFLFNIED